MFHAFVFRGVSNLVALSHSTTQLQEPFRELPMTEGTTSRAFFVPNDSNRPNGFRSLNPWEKVTAPSQKRSRIESLGKRYDSWVWFEATQHVCGHKFWPHAILGNTRIVSQPEVHRHFRGDFPVLNYGVTLAVVSLRFWNYERDGIFTYMDHGWSIFMVNGSKYSIYGAY